MKRILLNLALTAVAALWCLPSSATWEKDPTPRTTAAEITAGKKYVLVNVCNEQASNKMLKAPTLAYAASDYVLDENVFSVVDAGKNAFTGEQMWYLKSEATGLYFGGISGFKANMEDALAITLGSARQTTVLEKGEGWTEDEPVWPTTGKIPFWDWKEGDAITLLNYTADDEAYTLAHVWGWDNYLECSWYTIDPTNREVGTAINPWYFYEVTWVDNPIEDLAILVDSYRNAGYTDIYKAGDTPGWYEADKALAFQNMMVLCDSLLLDEQTTDEMLTAARNDLIAAKKAVEAAIIPVTDGWYFFKSAYPAFMNVQKKEKAAYDDGTQLRWETFVPDHGKYVFHFAKQEDGTYAIQSLMTKRYVNGMNSTSETIGITQDLIPLGAGQFRISDETGNYHANGHANGSGTSGNMVHWTDGLNSSGAWSFVPITDMVKLDSMERAARQEAIVNRFNAVLAEAREDSAAGYVPKWYITNVSQISSNALDESEGSYAALIDGNFTDNGDNRTSFFCSSWHTALGEAHYLQFDVSATPLQTFSIYFTKRPGANKVNRPTYITILGSNDGTNFDSLTYIPQGGDSLPVGATPVAYYSAKPIDLGAPYKYLRFRVDSTDNMASVDPEGYPFFTLGEFNISDPGFPSDPERSMALREDMVPVYAALNTAITKAASLDLTEVTDNDTEELRQAIAAFQRAYPDTTLLSTVIEQSRDYVANVLVAVDAASAQMGQCTDEAAVTAVQQGADEAQAALTANPKMTRAEIDQRVETLTAINNKFLASVVMPDPNTWYYMESLCSTEGRENVYGSLVYPSENRIGANILWGDNIENGGMSAKYVWQFVPVEGKDGVYAVQNIGSGYYLGADRGLSTAYQLSDTIVEFRIHYVAGGQLSLIQNESANGAAHAQASGSVLVPWTAGKNSATAWTFVQVSDDEQASIVTAVNNTVSIYCLPYDVNNSFYAYSDESGDEEEPTAYAISGARFDDNKDITAIGLKAIEDEVIPAGTPFILILGDLNEEAGEELSLDLGLVYGSNISTDAKTVNGLVGIMSSTAIDKAGIGYFSTEDGLVYLEEDAKVTIAGQTGYIDGTLLAGASEEGDLFLEVKDGVITKVADAKADTNALVTVYSVDGKVVRKNVKAADALKGLAKGIYVVNGKTVSVK